VAIGSPTGDLEVEKVDEVDELVVTQIERIERSGIVKDTLF